MLGEKKRDIKDDPSLLTQGVGKQFGWLDKGMVIFNWDYRERTSMEGKKNEFEMSYVLQVSMGPKVEMSRRYSDIWL